MCIRTGPPEQRVNNFFVLGLTRKGMAARFFRLVCRSSERQLRPRGEVISEIWEGSMREYFCLPTGHVTKGGCVGDGGGGGMRQLGLSPWIGPARFLSSVASR